MISESQSGGLDDRSLGYMDLTEIDLTRDGELEKTLVFFLRGESEAFAFLFPDDFVTLRLPVTNNTRLILCAP